MILFKDKINECVGCGYCCISTMCGVGLYTYGTHERCPGLYWDETRYKCKLVAEFGEDLYIGEGCCSGLNSWRRNVRQRKDRKDN